MLIHKVKNLRSVFQEVAYEKIGTNGTHFEILITFYELVDFVPLLKSKNGTAKSKSTIGYREERV